MTDPTIFQQHAVDLADVKGLAELRETQRQQEAMTREQEKLIAWDRAMTRAFKGIVPRSTRVIFARAAVKAAERDD